MIDNYEIKTAPIENLLIWKKKTEDELKQIIDEIDRRINNKFKDEDNLR